MGVKELWPILEPVKKSKSFEDMRGETVAIDLSLWIVDSQCVKQMVGTVTKPHLRNLFFRTSALLHAGILPVFVIEGDAPELKWQTMADRQQARHGKTSVGKGKVSMRRANRSHFNSDIRECCEMLDYLGVPYAQSVGEAEALCAALNSCGLVDAVITEDGDAFLYGAKIVYKNFTTTKTPGVDSYSILDVEKDVQLHRNHLIALGLLVGCDYCPKGVPGVGRIQAVNLCEGISCDLILKRLLDWSSKGLHGDETYLQKAIAAKIIKMGTNNFSKVIREFMNEGVRTPSSIGHWRKPLISKAQNYNLVKLEWPINYSIEKILPLMTLWSMRCVVNLDIPASELSIRPERIVKKRVRQGVDCLEILWIVNDPYDVDESDDKQPSLVTIEPLTTIKECFPLLVHEFLTSKPVKPSKVSKPRTTVKTLSQDNIPTMKTISIGNHATTKGTLAPDTTDRLSHLALDDFYDSSLPTKQVLDVDNPLAADTGCTLTKLSDLKKDCQYNNDSVISLSDDDSLTLSGTRDDRARADFHLEELGDIISSSLTLNSSDCYVAALQCGKQYQPSLSLSPVNLLDSSLPSADDGCSDVECLLMTKDITSIFPRVAPSQRVIPRVAPSQRPEKRDSIDMLLADISDQLRTDTFDSFLVDYREDKFKTSSTPEKETSPYAGRGNTNFGPNMSASRLSGDFTDSDVSLFSVSHRMTPVSRNDGVSITESTPIESTEQSVIQRETDTKPHHHMTYGDFDIIPQLSALSFNE